MSRIRTRNLNYSLIYLTKFMLIKKTKIILIISKIMTKLFRRASTERSVRPLQPNRIEHFYFILGIAKSRKKLRSLQIFVSV